MPTHSHLGNKSGGEKMEKKRGGSDLVHYYRAMPILRYFPPFLKKTTTTYLQTEKNGQLTFEKVKKQKIRHSKLALQQ